ncbi:uncharacterized protein ACA1_227370 [Acanthamoeba castellanii str. Neff]|uniref:Uncharacterized protein n=1 Tax=Acanthamoeba castellanii (strain ATCC 30010 / Neff) TaxID=1257118 RepID=L8H8M2_ACACF|nr:uncharacterized protein ACA1_227370 [Acanthamoeba castellanii str. Neff]ELR21567.1 hypothetical protein ACA1_227370 [Acanthamoeba castellanii str. Neff]
MKGKWHAKITLSKLLAIDPKTDRTRLDFVTEKLFDDALLFASLGIGADHSLHPCVTNGTGGLSKRQQPDPRQQSMRVLAPPATRKELVVASKDYYQRLLTNHLTQGAADLPLESSLVQELLPALHSRAWKPRNGREGYSLFVSKAQQSWTEEEREHHFVFGAQEWARHLMELLRIYQRSTNDRQRQAVLEANRLVWLCLPPLRQELGAVLQATAQQSPQPSRPMPEVAAYQERSLRGSLPDTPYHHHHNSSASNNGYHSAVPSQARHSSPSSSPLQATPPPPRQPSNILPSLSSLLLLPSLPSPMPAAQQPAPSHSYRPLAPATNDYHDMGNKRKRERWQSPAQPCTFV